MYEFNAMPWSILKGRKVLFCHQSIGQNILQGVKDITASTPETSIDFIRLGVDKPASDCAIYHTTIGSNKEPESKCKSFEKIVAEHDQIGFDLAFFKFCCIDFDSETNIHSIFSVYQKTMERLKKEFPDVMFMHATVPLAGLQNGPKAWIKAFIGRPLGGREDNAVRCRFNELLKQCYKGIDPIFDLAAIESTYLNGDRAVLSQNGKSIHYLVAEFTNDGVHLNRHGRKHVATNLLTFLADIFLHHKK